MTDGNGKYNGHGGEDSAEEEEDKVISFSAMREQVKAQKKAEERARRAGREPLINLPPATKAMLLIIIVVHLVMTFLHPETRYWAYMHFGFVPGYYTGGMAFPGWPAFAGPLTYMFVHGTWAHLGLNGIMLAAFGTGVEKWLGSRRLIVFFVACSLISALAHFALNPYSTGPVVGASGGLSGLFAAVLMMLHYRGLMARSRFGIWPFVILWILISFLFGSMSNPATGDAPVAWAAHIGGFLGGFVVLKIMLSRFK